MSKKNIITSEIIAALTMASCLLGAIAWIVAPDTPLQQVLAVIAFVFSSISVAIHLISKNVVL